MNDTQLIAMEVCTHPEIATAPPDLMGLGFQCMQCGKKVIIPNTTLLDADDTTIAGIIGLAFGEQWAKIVRGKA